MGFPTALRITTVWSWSLLGFTRGLNSYDYYKKHTKYENEKQSFYLDKVGWGFGGTLAYINPVTFWIALYKEVYRIEVYIRGLEDQKQTPFYNEVL